MECMSCKADINPKWKFAIENNSCPCCGQQIMEEELKALLSSLSNVVNSFAEKYSTQLDHWLLANFDYIKTNSPDIVNYLPKGYISKPVGTSAAEIIVHDSVSQNDSNLIRKHSDEETSKFFVNAEASKSIAKAAELKQMLQKIKDDNPGIEAAVAPQHDEDEDYDQSANNTSDSSWGADDAIPAAVLAFSNSGGHSNADGASNSKDIIRMQQLQQKTIDARRAVLNGSGGKGSFSRS